MRILNPSKQMLVEPQSINLWLCGVAWLSRRIVVRESVPDNIPAQRLL